MTAPPPEWNLLFRRAADGRTFATEIPGAFGAPIPNVHVRRYRQWL